MAKRAIDPATPGGVAVKTKVMNNVLPILVARAGGSVEITREEFAEVSARYGGPSQMALRFEQIGDGAAMRVTLFRKPAREGELPV